MPPTIRGASAPAEERLTQIDGAGFSCRQRFGQMGPHTFKLLGNFWNDWRGGFVGAVFAVEVIFAQEDAW